MKTNALEIERTYNAPVNRLWKAITDAVVNKKIKHSWKYDSYKGIS